MAVTRPAVPLHSLPLFVRLNGRNVILLGEGEAADAKRRLLDRAGAVVVGEDAPAALAIVAVEDEDACQAAVARLKARGVLVNAVDRPALCDFTLPAIVDRAPVLIAIGTGGVSAGLAAALRQRLEGMLPAGLGTLADGLFAARDSIRATYPGMGERRRAISDALAPGGTLDPFDAGAATRLVDWSNCTPAKGEGQSVPPPARGYTVEVVRLLSADPDDLTLRQARLLANADRVFHRADVAPAILDRARADAARIECSAPPTDPGPGLSVDVTASARA